ncbi:hypothetical protein ACFL35_04250 [Candidatus Riflebacteria bacterium]
METKKFNLWFLVVFSAIILTTFGCSVGGGDDDDVTTTETVSVSGSIAEPTGNVLFAIKARGAIKAATSWTSLTVDCNGVAGSVDSSGNYTVSGITKGTLYKIKVKKDGIVILKKYTKTTGTNNITTTTTAIAIVYDKQVVNDSGLDLDTISSTSSAVTSLITVIENIFKSATGIAGLSSGQEIDSISTVKDAADNVVSTDFPTPTTTTTSSTTTTTSAATTTTTSSSSATTTSTSSSSSSSSADPFAPTVSFSVTNTNSDIPGLMPFYSAAMQTVGPRLEVHFSEEMDSTTITSATVFLSVSTATTTPILASYTLDTAKKVWTIIPAAALTRGSIYWITVKGSSVKDVAGNAAAATICKFGPDNTPPTAVTTGSTVASGSAIDSSKTTLTVGFSENMATTTLVASISLDAGATDPTFTGVSVSGRVLSITGISWTGVADGSAVNVNFAAAGQAKSIADSSLLAVATDCFYSFKYDGSPGAPIASITAPTSPLPGATGVAITAADFTASFTEDILDSTLTTVNNFSIYRVADTSKTNIRTTAANDQKNPGVVVASYPLLYSGTWYQAAFTGLTDSSGNAAVAPSPAYTFMTAGASLTKIVIGTDIYGFGAASTTIYENETTSNLSGVIDASSGVTAIQLTFSSGAIGGSAIANGSTSAAKFCLATTTVPVSASVVPGAMQIGVSTATLILSRTLPANTTFGIFIEGTANDVTLGGVAYQGPGSSTLTLTTKP